MLKRRNTVKSASIVPSGGMIAVIDMSGMTVVHTSKTGASATAAGTVTVDTAKSAMAIVAVMMAGGIRAQLSLSVPIDSWVAD